MDYPGVQKTPRSWWDVIWDFFMATWIFATGKRWWNITSYEGAILQEDNTFVYHFFLEVSNIKFKTNMSTRWFNTSNAFHKSTKGTLGGDSCTKHFFTVLFLGEGEVWEKGTLCMLESWTVPKLDQGRYSFFISTERWPPQHVWCDMRVATGY